MSKSNILLASLALLLMSCSDSAPEPTLSTEPERSTTPATPTTVPAPASPSPSTESTTSTSAPPPSTTHPTEPESIWPADPPERYAVFEDGALMVVDGTERHETSAMVDAPTTGAFVGDVLVFSVGCCDGTWIWDYAGSTDAELVVSGESGDHVTLHGVAKDWEQPGFFYTTGGDEPGDSPDLMFYDLAAGDAHRFLRMSDRRPGLTGEEQDAPVGRVVATEDRVGLLFTFGDGTWVEWYTDTGQPTEPSFEGIDGGDTVLDLTLAPDGDLLAVGREERLHHGITTVDVVTTDGEVRRFSVPEPQSLRHLQFDGRYLTASVHRTDPAGGPEGPPEWVILDTENNQFSYFPGPAILALGGS